MDSKLIGKLENIRGWKVIKSDQKHIMVDIRDFGMDASELSSRLLKHGIEVHKCGNDCIRIDAESMNQRLIDVISSVISDWGRDLASRNLKDVLNVGRCVGRRDCEYYPCHFEGQDCTFCFCPFYPCNDERTGGRLVESSTGGMVWSCVDCTIIHDPDVAQEVLEELMVLKPGENLRSVFDRVIASSLGVK